MELQFHKRSLPCLQKVTAEAKELEQTQELRLPDGMPDIGRVLGVWGQILLRGKEWRSESISASGGVMAWVLYTPEEGGEVRSLETWIPFQQKWDIPDTHRDGNICVCALLRFLDARSISARKLMLRMGITLRADAWLPGEAELYEAENVPQDIQLLKNTYPMCLPKEAGEKPFSLDEEFTLPGQNAEKLIFYSLRPEITDQKVMAGKAVFRGDAGLHVVYRGQDGQLYSFDEEIPFSQFAELEGEYDADAMLRMLPAVTGLELELGEDGRLHMKAGLTGQYVIYDRTPVELVQDAYSPVRTVTPQLDTLQLPVVLEELSRTVDAEKNVQAEGSRMVNVTFCPRQPRVSPNGDGVTLELDGQFQMLYYDMEGALQCLSSGWEEQLPMEADGNSTVEVTVMPTGSSTGGLGSDALLRGSVRLDTLTGTRQGMPMVMGLEMTEQHEPDPQRPSLIVRSVGEGSLWELAKKTGSTVDAIRKANNLQQEPEDSQLLLIPVL